MTLRSKSCVIGRGVEMFSICSAIAFASKMPTQIGSTFCPSRSRRITIGMFVMGSTINPLMDISICMVPNLGAAAGAVNHNGVRRRLRDRLRPQLRPRLRHRAAPDAVRTGALHADAHHAADPVNGPRQVDWIGRMMRVRVERAGPHSVWGRPVSEPRSELGSESIPETTSDAVVVDSAGRGA